METRISSPQINPVFSIKRAYLCQRVCNTMRTTPVNRHRDNLNVTVESERESKVTIPAHLSVVFYVAIF